MANMIFGFPDTEEERKVMEEFCLKRRRDNNE